MMDRYSRALNSRDWNSVNRGPALLADRSLFEARSHALDLLNVTFVATYSNLSAEPERMTEKDGILFTGSDSPIDLSDKEATVLTGGGGEADALAIVTTLANSSAVAGGASVARLSIHTTDGRIIERNLRAGDDTAEWAHERADVIPHIRHQLAPVFDSRPGDEQNSFPAYRYWSRIDLGGRVRVKQVELTKLLANANVVIWKGSLYDSLTGRSAPLMTLDAARWEPVYQKDGVLLLRNHRALPRAWLVTEAQAVDQTEAWAMIRGQGARRFDPRRTALVELEPSKMPALSGRPLSSDSFARIVSYEPHRLVIETNSDQQAVLVVSEMNYPGWAATLDDIKIPIHQTNYLLRGIVVPAGKHRIAMNFTAIGARNGAVISLLTILLIGVIVLLARRRLPHVSFPSAGRNTHSDHE
jgi:hypothetical protein